MGTEILHFGQLETEKNELKIFNSNLQRPKIWMHKILLSIFTKLQTQFSHLLLVKMQNFSAHHIRNFLNFLVGSI